MIDEEAFLEGVRRIIEEGIRPALKGRCKFVMEHAWLTSPHFKAASLCGVSTELERVHCDITLRVLKITNEYEWAVLVHVLRVPLPISVLFGKWLVYSTSASVSSVQEEPSVSGEFVENIRAELEGAMPTPDYVEPVELDFDVLLRPVFARELYDEVVSIYFLRFLAGC